MTTSNKPDWAELLRRLERDWCPCGSGGPMACDEDCPGDRTNPALVEAVKTLLQAQIDNQELARRLDAPDEPHCDGVTDDTPFIQSCIDRGLPIPFGTYQIRSPITLRADKKP